MKTQNPYLDTSVPEPFAAGNRFRNAPPERKPLPRFDSARAVLPDPFWQGHELTIACYWRAWEIAFRNLRQPPRGSPFIANFIDTAFNDATFMWDSSFMTMFGRYGIRAFNFQRTLDNFYARQHQDGYISREIIVATGAERFERFDPSSTGPNIMPWAEWEYYRQTGDKERLAMVFPALVAFTHWFRKYRTWPDGTYWSSGWGCGMDNQPRQPAGYSEAFDHGHMSWIDTTLQAILANRILLLMAAELGRSEAVRDSADEVERLTSFVNTHLWNERLAFYCDRFRDGTLSKTKSIGAYWALLAGIVPADRLGPFLSHLSDAAQFNTPHRVPSLSADDPAYRTDGGYWLGGVWAPTNYMVLRGLTATGADLLAHEIALNHVAAVTAVFQESGTVFENYAPASATPGNPAKKDFVGWTGLSPIAILFEYVFGLRPDAAKHHLLWDVRILEGHGIRRYPFGPGAVLDLKCAGRSSATDEPVVEATSSEPVTLTVRWASGEKRVNLGPPGSLRTP